MGLVGLLLCRTTCYPYPNNLMPYSCFGSSEDRGSDILSCM